MADKPILLTGATGYIGGRLLPRLLDAGHRVRVLVRDRERVTGRPWADRVEIVQADLLDRASLGPALEGIGTAYYLSHAMDAGRGFAQRDRLAATNFADAGKGLAQVIYLGGLQPSGQRVSAHLASRAEVGRILAAHLPTIEFRAGPIIGSGSASFEMVRYLTERLPVMICPRWVKSPVQPIAVRDVLAYLIAALESPAHGVVDIGADRLTFKQMMLTYAAVRGLPRVILPVPVLAPGLAARWVGLVTPIPNSLAVPLVKGIIHAVVADTTRARQLFPGIEPLAYRRAVELALERTERGQVKTRWSGSLGQSGDRPRALVEDREGLIREVRSRHVAAPPARVFAVFSAVGGEAGWPAWDWAWRVRGLLDRLIGGPGLRRGRRHPTEVLPGEAIDFWRVDAVEPGRRLRLHAEMKLPGIAWLEWGVEPEGEGSRLVQTASFAPTGFGGWVYWHGLYPLHRLIFTAMARNIARRAERADASPGSG